MLVSALFLVLFVKTRLYQKLVNLARLLFPSKGAGCDVYFDWLRNNERSTISDVRVDLLSDWLRNNERFMHDSKGAGCDP